MKRRRYGSTRISYELIEGILDLPEAVNIDLIQTTPDRRLINVYFSNYCDGGLSNGITFDKAPKQQIIETLTEEDIIERMRTFIKKYDEEKKGV